MDTNFLYNFVVIVNTGSIAEASRRLDVSPTALTQQVRALERELDVALLERAGRSVAATPAGHRLVMHAELIVKGIAQLREDITASHGGASEFRLGTINTPLQSFVPDTLVYLSRKNPKLNVFIKAGYAGHLLEDVKQGAVDAAIIPHPLFDLPKSLIWQELVVEPLVVLAPAWLSHDDPHDLLARQPFVRYDRQHWGGRLAESYLRQVGIVPHERFELSSLLTIAVMVDRALGVSLIPDSRFPVPAGLRLARLPLPQAAEPRRIGLVWRRGSPLSDVAVDVAQCAKRALQQSGPDDTGNDAMPPGRSPVANRRRQAMRR